MIDGGRFPLSQRVRRLKAILDKLDPPPRPSTPFPSSKPPDEPEPGATQADTKPRVTLA